MANEPNVNPDGTLKVAGFSRMSNEDILEKILKTWLFQRAFSIFK